LLPDYNPDMDTENKWDEEEGGNKPSTYAFNTGFENNESTEGIFSDILDALFGDWKDIINGYIE
jgi:hypothetical protein